ncbi:hypothetical protein [Aquimarina sp. Aq107]|uniref:hypothetical protein n=1 Tax=Aquimarina sp. Aq107 TaxID=1191912 RepID=UPI000D560FE8|nr:hypothetical protein [Aquimarina sp. Aq107]
MEHKIKIKIGTIEIEYEGNENYLKKDLPDLIDKIISLKSSIPDDIEPQIPEQESNSVTEVETTNNGSTIQMSTNSIAAKLNAKTGTDVTIAASAHLVFVQGKDTFHRKEILTEMKKASNYYKSSHGKNLSVSLKTLTGSHKIIERKKDTYALSASLKKSLNATLNAG